VTLGVDATTEVEDLLLVADEALYRAKANGRNRVEATAPDADRDVELAGAPSIVPILRANRIGAAA
jgi:hypothetical protein